MTQFPVTRRGAVTLGFGGLVAIATRGAARAEPVGLATGWAGHKNGRVRLIACALASMPAGPVKLYAGVHVQLGPGWKTYWRQPGEAGVPPSFEWAGSANLASARVLYPVPQRLADAGMTSLGYKSEVVFPVEITPRALSQPIALQLVIEYGVCKDICIPAEAQLSLVIPASLAVGADPVSALVGAHLARVPLPTAPGYPSVTGFKAEMIGTTPQLVINANFPQGSEGADVLIEIAGGELAPFAVVTGRKGREAVRFEARFASAAEAQRFAGKPLLLTLFSANAQAEAGAQMP